MSASDSLPDSPIPQPPRLLDQFRVAAGTAGQPESWIESLTWWVLAFIVFHGKLHRRDLDAAARSRRSTGTGTFSTCQKMPIPLDFHSTILTYGDFLPPTRVLRDGQKWSKNCKKSGKTVMRFQNSPHLKRLVTVLVCWK